MSYQSKLRSNSYRISLKSIDKILKQYSPNQKEENQLLCMKWKIFFMI